MNNAQKISLIKAHRRVHEKKCDKKPCRECEKFSELLKGVE